MAVWNTCFAGSIDGTCQVGMLSKGCVYVLLGMFMIVCVHVRREDVRLGRLWLVTKARESQYSEMISSSRANC